MTGVVFDWCSGMEIIMNKQLSDCNLGKNKNIGHASIFVAFFFERVPALSPRERLPPSPPCEPRITQWGDVLLRQGGGKIRGGFDDEFYASWSRQVPSLEKFPYAGLDLHGDP